MIKMHIAQFNTDDIHGGAAKASYRLFQSLDKYQITYFVKNKTLDLNNIIKLQNQTKQYISLEQKTNNYYINKNRTSISNTLFSFTCNSIQLPNLNKYDIINLHWIEYFLSLDNLYEIVKSKKPIVWTLHDMKPFTGGCHYASDCEQFKDSCQSCTQLQKDSFKLPKKVLDIKKSILNNANLTIVTPSKWLKKEAKKSHLFKNKKIVVIPNAIDSNIFKAWNKKEAKKYFDIDTNSIVLGFGAASHKERRKGFKELIEALTLIKNDLKEHNIKALFFGTSKTNNFPIKTINLGEIKDEEVLSKVYSAVDIFILPSLEDNLPNTILESLSCETPIIAFNSGGIGDIVNNTNGILVPKRDIKSLSNAIISLVKNKKLREKLGREGKKLILKKYQPDNQAKKYIKLYKKIFFSSKSHQSDFKEINIEKFINELSGYILNNYPDNQSILFSKKFNSFYTQINQLNNKYTYVIYGNGTIGKTIQKLIPEKIVGYVDIADENNHPSSLKNMKYDKILISVLGREDEIITYLSQELHIEKNRIITFEL